MQYDDIILSTYKDFTCKRFKFKGFFDTKLKFIRKITRMKSARDNTKVYILQIM